MNKTLAIIVIVVILVIAGIIAWIGATIMGNIEKNDYCSNWSNNLEQQRAIMENQIFPDTNQFNAEVAQYNRECAF